MFSYFYALQKSSASKVGQLASLEPVTTPLFAIVLLQETLSPESLLAILFILVGLLLLLVDRGVAKAVYTAKFAVLPIFLALLLWSSQDILTKLASETQNVWTLYFWIRTGSAVVMSSLLIQQKNREDLVSLIYNYKSHRSYYLVLSNSITAIGLFAAISAINRGPLSIVSPLLATYSVFSLLFSIFLTKLTSYEVHTIENKYVVKRIVSIFLFLVGIVLLSS